MALASILSVEVRAARAQAFTPKAVSNGGIPNPTPSTLMLDSGPLPMGVYQTGLKCTGTGRGSYLFMITSDVGVARFADIELHPPDGQAGWATIYVFAMAANDHFKVITSPFIALVGTFQCSMVIYQ